MATKTEVNKADVEAQIAKLEKSKEKETDPKEQAALRRQIRSLKKSIGTFVPRGERTTQAEAKASKTKTAVKAEAAKPAAKATTRKRAA